MSAEPWFKFFAADYLVDPDVDAMPREAEALLIRMLCLCHIEGSAPADPEELARKTRCNLQYVLQCKPHCDPLFELQDGRLYSRRMEEEKRRSEQARKNANKRYNKGLTQSAVQTAVPVAVPTALPRSDYDSDYRSKEKPNEIEVRKKVGFNSSEVAQILCQKSGWSGTAMNWSLREAIDFQSKQMPEENLEQVGEWLVHAYSEYKSTKGKFAVGPQKFYEQGLYRDASAPSGRSTSQEGRNNPAEYAAAQLEVQ